VSVAIPNQNFVGFQSQRHRLQDRIESSEVALSSNASSNDFFKHPGFFRRELEVFRTIVRRSAHREMFCKKDRWPGKVRTGLFKNRDGATRRLQTKKRGTNDGSRALRVLPQVERFRGRLRRLHFVVEK
jgi:hypothetical protein